MSHTKQAMLEQMRGLDALRRYIEMRQAMPLNGLGDSVHHIHASTEYEAELRFSDLVSVVEQFSSPWPMLSIAQRPVNLVTDAMVEAGAKALCLAQFGEEATHGDARCCQVGGKDGCCLHEVRKDALACLEAALSSAPSTEPCACLRPGGDPLGNCEECSSLPSTGLPAPAPHAEVREALEFYADPFAWKKKHDPEDVVRVPDFYSETSFGDTALEALSALALPQSTERGGE